jgi:nitroreductase
MMRHAGRSAAQGFPYIYPIQEQLHFLLRYAVMAPSTRNTQPWRFAVDGCRVTIRADLARTQPVADRDRRELYLSLGCAMENLVVAAEQFGFRHSVAYLPNFPDELVAAAVAFRAGGHRSAERANLRLQTIAGRRTAHGRFTDEKVSEDDVFALRQCVAERDLELSLVSDQEHRGAVGELHRVALETTLADPAFREELAEWVGQGALGTPWPMSVLGRVTIGSGVLAHRLARLEAVAVGSAPLLALVSSRDDGRPAQIRSGQLLERLWLTAEALGLGVQPLSASLELSDRRVELSRAMEARLPCAQQLVRIGHPRGASGHRTPRRPLDEVIDPSGAET